MDVGFKRKVRTTGDVILRHFENLPQRMRIVRVLLQHGIAVRNGNLYINELHIPMESVASVAKVDSRNVRKTIKDIESNEELKPIFGRLRIRVCTEEVGRFLKNTNVLGIIPEDASSYNLAASVLQKVANHELSVRNVICEDFDLFRNPQMLVVVAGAIPNGLVRELKEVKGVKSVTVYSKSEK